MNWFKRMVINWVREDWEHARQAPDDCYPTAKLSRGMNTVSTRGDIDSDPTLNFKVYSAVGGKIVEFMRYDRKNDRQEHQIYIIGKDEDFGEKIAKISSLEVLR
jgi:hypothetical protein